MKYNEKNKPLQMFMTQSTCYQKTSRMVIKGVLWHSTGANNPQLSRYCQPDDNSAQKSYFQSLLGTNKYHNDWNHIYHEAGLNAWIGKTAKGEVITLQTMPWDFRPWGCGSGVKGSCNNGFIQFELCEDSLEDKAYFNAIYKEGIELTAYLCKLYGLNPNGYTTVNGVKVPVILCHYDSYKLGLGSNHGDVYKWFKKYGKTMDDVRKDVAKLMVQKEQEVEEMTKEEVKKIVQDELSAQAQNRKTNNCASWSAEARDWAIKNGIINGIGNGVYAWPDYLTREQAATIFYRLYTLLKGD